MQNQTSYLITEGNLDKFFLEKILPSNISDKVRIVSGDGMNSAISLARSRYIDGNNKILLLVDADTVDPIIVEDKREKIENMIYSLSGASKVKIVVFVPEIEKLLVTDKAFIESYFDKNLNDFEFDLIQNDPKFGLLKLTKDNSKSISQICTELLNQADETVIKKMQNHHQIQEIINYFKSA